MAALVLVSGCPRVEKPGFEHEELPPDLGASGGNVGLGTEGSLLQGPRALGRPGDWVVRNGEIVAVFRKEDGQLVDMGFRSDRQDLLSGLDTVVSDTRGRYRVFYHLLRLAEPPAGLSLAGQSPSGKVLELVGRVRDLDLNLEVHTFVWAPPGRPVLVLRTTVRNASRTRVVHVGLGDDVYFGNSRLFVPGHGLVADSATLHASWVGRQASSWSWALASGEPEAMRLDFKIYSPGFNPMVRATYLVANLARNATLTATRYLVLVKGPLAGASALVQELLGGQTCRASVRVPALPVADPAPEVEVRSGRYPVLRTRLSDTAAPLVLPGGRNYEARILVPGAGPGPWTALTCGKETPLELPRMGQVRVLVRTEKREPIPARLLVEGIRRTPKPDFGPDGTPAGIQNLVYAWNGTASFVLAPGEYVVSAFHGLRRVPAWRTIRVRAGSRQDVRLTLHPLVLYGPPLLSGDFHLHASPSPDSPLSLKHRLAQLACTGVDLAVATDHNVVTDYRPALPENSRMLVFPGDEVTTKRSLLGHFNVFPLEPGTKPLPYRNAPFSELVAAWRRYPGPPIIQANHPRLTYMGYLNQVDFDPAFGRPFAPGFVTDLDAMEVFNGTRLHRPDKVGRVLRDWFVLLNMGVRLTATGNSDSHRLAYQEAGYPRNLLVWRSTKARPSARDLAAIVRAGKLIVSSGPVLQAYLPDGTSALGATLRPGTEVTVFIGAACHVDPDRLVLIRNGVPVAAWLVGGCKAMPMRPRELLGPAARIRGPAFVEHLLSNLHIRKRHWPPYACWTRHNRVTVRLRAEEDSWFVFLAYSTEDNPSLLVRGALVAAFTNPIWVDADGDGKLSLPGPPEPPPTR